MVAEDLNGKVIKRNIIQTAFTISDGMGVDTASK